MRSSSDNYLASHSSVPNEALEWLEKQTNLRTNYPQMLSGSIQGQLLKMLVEISGARRILEIGSFTGYSAICLASGLPADGHLDALEINDELEDLMREAWSRAGVSGLITLHIGDAIEFLKATTSSIGGRQTSASLHPTTGSAGGPPVHEATGGHGFLTPYPAGGCL